jgi:ELWxxDGT repeat protein
LFAAFDSTGLHGNLWTTNATAAGTVELTGISGANPAGLNPSFLTAYSGEVLFGGQDANQLYNLWVTDGTSAGTHELTGVANASTSLGLIPSDLTVYNGKVIFAGLDASNDSNIWLTDGTVAGTYELTGVAGANELPSPGFPFGGLNPTGFTVYNGKCCSPAKTPTNSPIFG